MSVKEVINGGEDPIGERLTNLGLTLPSLPVPAGNYHLVQEVGQMLYMSGLTPKKEGVLCCKGKVGWQVSLKQAYEATRQCLLNHLAVLKQSWGTWIKLCNL